MAVLLSSGLKKEIVGDKSLVDILNGGILNIYAGVPPASADDPADGTLLVSITKNGSTTQQNKVVQVSIDTAVDSFEYFISLNGVKIKYTSGVGEDTSTIATNLKANLDAVIDSSKYDISKISGQYTTDISSNIITITATDFKNDFIVETADNMSVSVVTEALYTLHFDPSSTDAGALIKRASEVWQGTCLVDGTASYYRYVKPEDDNTASTDFIRIQGTVGTYGTDMIVSSTNLVKDSIQSINEAVFYIPINV